MEWTRTTVAQARAFAADVDAALGFPRPGRHRGPGLRVKMPATYFPGAIGWAPTACKIWEQRNGTYAVEVRDWQAAALPAATRASSRADQRAQRATRRVRDVDGRNVDTPQPDVRFTARQRATEVRRGRA